ncbi:hypothetical protein AB0M43_23865 [Longispora sp. NPDC051575]|uniref:hypothetical protein n=1 Tax=Longispora sp. NPDC051575 TaxID=3154943 RepID=UPI0034484964
MVATALLILAATLAVPAIERRTLRHDANQALAELVPPGWGNPARDGLDTLIGWRLDQPAASTATVADRARAAGWTARPCGPGMSSCWTRDGYTLTTEEPCRPGTRPCRLRVAVSWTDPWIRDALLFPAATAVLLLAAAGWWAHRRRNTPADHPFEPGRTVRAIDLLRSTP